MLKRLIKTTYKHRTTVLLERESGLGIIGPSDELEEESLDSDFLWEVVFCMFRVV